MSFGTSTSDSGSISQIDPRLYADWQRLNDAAQRTVQEHPYEAYQGQRVASDNPFEDYAQYRTLQAADMGQGAIGEAQKVYGGVANDSPTWMDAQQVGPAAQRSAAQVGDILDINPALAGVERASAGSVAGASLSPYLNPYQSAVIDQSNRELDRQKQMTDARNAYAATQAGAFGGSRHGVVDAENARNYAQMRQDNTNSLLQAGYGQAQGLLQADLDRAAQASQFNATAGNTAAGQNADRLNAAQQYNSQADYQARLGDAQMRQQAMLAGADAQDAANQFNAGQRQLNQQQYREGDLQQSALNLQGAQGLLAAGQQQQQQYLAGANALATSGASQRTIDQANLDAQYEAFLRRMAAPQEQLNILAQPFGLIPANQQSTSSSSGKSVSGGR